MAKENVCKICQEPFSDNPEKSNCNPKIHRARMPKEYAATALFDEEATPIVSSAFRASYSMVVGSPYLREDGVEVAKVVPIKYIPKLS